MHRPPTSRAEGGSPAPVKRKKCAFFGPCPCLPAPHKAPPRAKLLAPRVPLAFPSEALRNREHGNGNVRNARSGPLWVTQYSALRAGHRVNIWDWVLLWRGGMAGSLSRAAAQHHRAAPSSDTSRTPMPGVSLMQQSPGANEAPLVTPIHQQLSPLILPLPLPLPPPAPRQHRHGPGSAPTAARSCPADHGE